MNEPIKSRPARKIGIKSRSVSGEMPGMGAYESTLERDFMELLRFDLAVAKVTPQPLKIQFVKPDGSAGAYFPDGLIEFKTLFAQPPILYEVKFRADFRKNWRELMPKFRAAKDYCMSRGWRFDVFTEREIRTPYLQNAKFLLPYRERQFPEPIKDWILQVMEDLIEAEVDLLLCALCKDKWNRAELIPAVWHLVAIEAIDCDLDSPLTMRSKLTSAR